jgi:transcriptional regulator with XRE-family HTH domain
MYKANLNKYLETLGEALKIIRCRKDLTQEVLAKKASVDKKYLGNLEQGKHSVGVLVMIKLCIALDINIFEILTLAWEEEYKAFLKLQK